jgi:acetyl esterase/lipase
LAAIDQDDIPVYTEAEHDTDLDGLTPTFIGVDALDVFSDEGVAYANELRHAGVPVGFHEYLGTPQGFDGLTPNTPTARQANHFLESWHEHQLSA